MNESGQSVGEAARFLKISEGDVVVFHDELDLLPGRIKVKTGGGNAATTDCARSQRILATRPCASASASGIRGPRMRCLISS